MADYSKLNEAAAAETKTGFTAQPYQPGAPVSNQPPVPQYGYVQRPPQPSDHLGLSLFSLVCCFWPMGLIALIFSFRSRYRYYDNDYAGSIKYSKSARNWARGAILTGVIVIIAIILLYFFAGALPQIIIAASGGYKDNTDDGEGTRG